MSYHVARGTDCLPKKRMESRAWGPKRPQPTNRSSIFPGSTFAPATRTPVSRGHFRSKLAQRNHAWCCPICGCNVGHSHDFLVYGRKVTFVLKDPFTIESSFTFCVKHFRPTQANVYSKRVMYSRKYIIIMASLPPLAWRYTSVDTRDKLYKSSVSKGSPKLPSQRYTLTYNADGS